MYQLGFTPATAEVPSMSEVALGANRWASRVVVVLQLAAWTAVGIVLLQKGVSSLQKIPVDVKNVTKANYTQETTIANLMMKKIIVSSSEELRTGDSSSAADDVFRDLEYSDHHKNLNKYSQSELIHQTEDELLIDRKIIPGVIPISSLTPNHLTIDKVKPIWNSAEKGSSSLQDEENLKLRNNHFYPNEGKDSIEEFSNTSLISSNDDDSNDKILTSTEKYDRIYESRKKIQMSNLNGGGAAAAAVAMVAVGAVMLVLGPVVIILRALDERRQERRFLKLSGQDDLPPSYEQATLMDEAPRYSTLNLNTIVNSSSTTTAVAETNPHSSSTAIIHSLENNSQEIYQV